MKNSGNLSTVANPLKNLLPGMMTKNVSSPPIKPASDFGESVGKVNRDTVSYNEMREFIISELGLEAHERAYQMIDLVLEVLLIKGQEVADRDYISR